MTEFTARSFYLLICIFVSSASNAVLVKLSDLQTMALKSDVVFHGYVGEQHIEYDRLGRIVTLTSLEVIDGLLGAKTGEVVTIVQLGGQLNGQIMPCLGGHRYRLSQELIFFGLALKDNKNNFVSFGAGQGKLDVYPDSVDSQVREDLGDINTFAPSAALALSYSSTETLKEEIRLMLKNRS